MSSLATLFESGERKNHKGHFRNLVLLARIDGKLDRSENDLLHKIALKLSLTDEQIQEIISNPGDFPSIPPSSREERYERFIQLIQVMGVDGRVDEKEILFVKRIGIEMGFTAERIDEKFPIIVSHLRNGMNREEVFRAVF